MRSTDRNRAAAVLPLLLSLTLIAGASARAQESSELSREETETAFSEEVSTTAPTRAEGKTIYLPRGFERAYETYHYSPAVRVGNRVILSGIPAAAGESYQEKVRSMFRVADLLLREAGATMADVVEITTYHVEARDSEAMAAELEQFLEVHREFFTEGYPAWTAVGTTALLAPSAVVEMRLEAIIGAGDEVRIVRPREEERQ